MGESFGHKDLEFQDLKVGDKFIDTGMIEQIEGIFHHDATVCVKIHDDEPSRENPNSLVLASGELYVSMPCQCVIRLKM